MDSSRWIDVGSLEDFPEGTPTLCKRDGHRFACVRVGDTLHAVDDRCPHQGYPLSRGAVNGGVLTCEWHNWKFELTTGNALFGGEPVRRYPAKIEAGRVSLDVFREPEAAITGHVTSLRGGMFEGDVARATRDALRIDAIRGAAGLGEGFSWLARDGAERAPWGFDHGLATLADLAAWASEGLLEPSEAFVAAAFVIAEPNVARPKRVAEAPSAEPMLDAGAAAASLADRLGREQRGDAEIGTRFVVRALGHQAAFDGLARFVARHLYDYGHGAIFLTKALEIAERFPMAAEEVMAAASVQLGWATAETKLPPFTATRTALEQLDRCEAAPTAGSAPFDRDAFEASVLNGEREAVTATMTQLAAGVDAITLLTAIGHAAAVRLSRFEAAWAHRVDADAGPLDVTHLVTFAEAALVIARRSTVGAELGPRLAVQAAGFVGKLRRGDDPQPRDLAARSVRTPDAHVEEVSDALRRRDPTRARALCLALEPEARLDLYRVVAPFAALEAAVRPIFVCHAVKVTRALGRLESADPHPGTAYAEALCHFLGTPWPESRLRRIATIARAFLADGRPPEGLY